MKRYFKIKKVTAVKKTMLTIPNSLKARSCERSACGVIKTMHAHTPTAHEMLKSSALFLRMRRKISGILKRGKTTPAITPMICIQSPI